METKIRKGKILVYRVYDIGAEIDLNKVEQLFENKKIKERFQLDRKNNKSLSISSAPVSVKLGASELIVEDRKVQADLVARVWDFGTVSLCFEIPILENTTWGQLISLGSRIEKDEQIEAAARKKSREFQAEIQAAISSPREWEINEDYIIYFIQEFSSPINPLSSLSQAVDIPALILAEPKEKLADSIKKGVLEHSFQYSEEDLVVVDWNSALVVEPSGSMDVPLMIEFALNQLLEMRYYDDLLDKRLNTLYNAVVGRKKGLLSNKYSRLAEESGQFYLEISEIVETVENSFKAVGDFYLATIFRATSRRFRFNDWKNSVNEKLGNLAEISKLLHSEVNESRNQVLEITIIILIAIEVIPFVYNLLK